LLYLHGYWSFWQLRWCYVDLQARRNLAQLHVSLSQECEFQHLLLLALCYRWIWTVVAIDIDNVIACLHRA